MTDNTDFTADTLKASVLSASSLAGLDVVTINRAIEYACKAHENQTRASGDAYVTHPLEVALLVIDLGGSADMVVCAILHDVVEDTPATLEDVEKVFGEKVKSLVEGCTKVSKVHPGLRDMSNEALTLRKLFVSLAEDPRVVIVKICDRLHNMRTIDYLPDDKKVRIGLETLAIHAPLAARLGLRALKSELEDRAFKAAYPQEYSKIDRLISEDGSVYETLMGAKETLTNFLVDSEISNFEVSGRLKHRWSIYNKLKNSRKDAIYDLLGLRIVVQSETECYAALSAVNSLWQPVHGRYKDYINKPKYNSYKSIHTTVATPDGVYVEIQIRTKKHHADAEFGAASHHAYKYSTNEGEWLKRLLDWSTDVEDPEEYIQGVKSELAEMAEVVVYSPTFQMYTLPKGSSVIDFAYKVHTDIGNSCISVKVNNKIVPLKHKVSSGDIVEVVTGPRSGPSEEWLEWTVTSRARSKIKQYHSRARKDSKLSSNADVLFKRWAEQIGVDVSTPEKVQKIVAMLSMPSFKELLVSLESNRYTLPAYLPAPEAVKATPENDMILRSVGLGFFPVKQAGCCTGQASRHLTGIIGKGVVVAHNHTCPQGSAVLAKDPGRYIKVYRTSSTQQVETVELMALPRPALHYEIAQQVLSVGAEALSPIEVSPSGFLSLDVGISPINVKNLKIALSFISGLKII